MLLYHTTRERGAERLLNPSGGGTPRARKGPHVVFTDRPLAGGGEWVYVVDADPTEVSTFEVEAPLQVHGVRCFRVPLPWLASRELTEARFEELTGEPWDVWGITLRSAQPDPANTWSQVWISRPGVATTTRYEESPDVRVQIRLTSKFDPTVDYVSLETQQWGGKEWRLELLAGTAPMWADFPSQWNDWVWDEAVQESAIQFIIDRFPELRRDVAYAAAQSSKVNRIRAWRIVAEKAGEALGRNLGKMPAGSWTSTTAMPIRIAQRVGGWIPPVPKPEFEHPDASGRILLASPAGMRAERGGRREAPGDHPPRHSAIPIPA